MSTNSMMKRAIVLWAIACTLSGVLLYAEQIRRQFWERDREFSALFSESSAVLTQNESVLPLLNGDEDITALRKNSPSARPENDGTPTGCGAGGACPRDAVLAL